MTAKMNRQRAHQVTDRIRQLEEDLSSNMIHTRTKYETGQDHSSRNLSNLYHRQTAKQEEQNFTRMAMKIRHPQRALNDFAGLASSIRQPHNSWDDYLKEEHEREPMKYKPDKNSSSLANQIGLNEVADRNFKKSNPQLSTMQGIGF